MLPLIRHAPQREHLHADRLFGSLAEAWHSVTMLRMNNP